MLLKKSLLSISTKELALFCEQNHIVKLSFFGSILRNDFTPESDIDILVQFAVGFVPGFIKLAGMELELSRLLGRKVDLRTEEDLSPMFRDEVLRQAQVQYVTQ